MIFYFSGTGNSLAVARRLGQDLDEPIMPLWEQLDRDERHIPLQAGERIGLVFPVYFYTVPRLVADFIRDLRFTATEKPYLFAVMTCGGQTGQAGRILEKMLFRQRLELSYQAAIVLPDNYIPLLHVPDKEKQIRLFLAADLDMTEITTQIAARKTGDCNTKKGPLPGLMTACAAPFYRNGCKTARFLATEACTRCRLCVNICPEQVIGMRDERPVWLKESCTFCLACLHRCPVQAIQYGRATKGKSRYMHPDLRKINEESIS